MKAVLINSKDRTITDVEFDGDWRSIGKMIDCSLFTVISGLPGGDDIFVDDEGLLDCNADTRFFKLPWYDAPVAGNGLVLGCNHETGDSIAVTHDAAFYQEQGIQFMGAETVWLHFELNGPAHSCFDSGPNDPDFTLLAEGE